jgi:hypothetical protein
MMPVDDLSNLKSRIAARSLMRPDLCKRHGIFVFQPRGQDGDAGRMIVGVRGGDFGEVVPTAENINTKPNVPPSEPLRKERNEEINRVERATRVEYFLFMRGVTSTGLGYVGFSRPT